MNWEQLAQKIINCEACPRLRLYCQGIARKRKKEFKDFEYWGRPVPSFGDPKAELWVVGLAPAAHGANRTGRMFTGDSSGDWLYRALFKFGFANQPSSSHLQDGLRLERVRVSAAVRCAPPDNRPSLSELRHCFPYLLEEFERLTQKKVLLALGQISFETLLKLLKTKGYEMGSPKPKFRHGARYVFDDLTLLASYHPSRQNTNTGRLTEVMWDKIFREARELISR
jgi:uracil-DNA glycosylase